MTHPRQRAYPPQSGIYLTQSLRPPYQIAVLWRGRVIASCWAGSYQRAREEAAALQESLAALKIIDRTDPQDQSPGSPGDRPRSIGAPASPILGTPGEGETEAPAEEEERRVA